MVTIQPIHKYDCDILVVGGGPSGSALAFHLAQRGIKVTVVESQKFPRDKICGDGVSAVALTELQKLGITSLTEFSKSAEVKQVGLFIEDKKVTIALSKHADMPFRSRVIPREQLDNWIYHAAKDAGATYIQQAKLSNYTVHESGITAEIKLETKKVHLKAKLIVGADGSNSAVARIFHGAKPPEKYQMIGLRAYYEGVEGPSDRVDIFFSESNFPGIFWLFPLGNGFANMGSAMIAHTLPKNSNHAKNLLIDQINNNKDIAARIGKGKIIGKIAGWPLVFRDPHSHVVGERVILVGDAAGLVNPLSGDGIQYALLSARWASECLAACVRTNDFSLDTLNVYKEKLDTEMAYDMALSGLLIQFSRNRALKSVWMEILHVLIERAAVDESYAKIIAGIFEGTVPSYRALNPDFILKSILQAGIHLGSNTMTSILKGPSHWANVGENARQFVTGLLKSLSENPLDHIKWLSVVAQNSLNVGAHIITDLGKNHLAHTKTKQT